MMKCKALTRLDYQGRKKGFLNSIKDRKLCDDDKSYGSSASFASPMGCLMVSEVKEKALHKQISNFLMNFSVFRKHGKELKITFQYSTSVNRGVYFHGRNAFS